VTVTGIAMLLLPNRTPASQVREQEEDENIVNLKPTYEGENL